MNIRNYRKSLLAIAAAISIASINALNVSVSAASNIGVDKAKEIALSHAELKASEVTFINAHLDWDDGRRVYEVEFYKDSTEYDYDIDAASGKIISYDYDVENYNVPAADSSSTTSVTTARAKEIALNHAGLAASEVTFDKVRLDWEDGRQVFEVEFHKNNTEYEYEIDASSGKIVSYDCDEENYHTPSRRNDYGRAKYRD